MGARHGWRWLVLAVMFGCGDGGAGDGGGADDARTAARAAADAGARPMAGAPSQSQAGSGADADAGSGAVPVARSDAGSDAEPESDPEGDAVPDAGADPGADAGSESDTESGPGTPTVVGVGAWGLRGSAALGSAWNICGNASTGDDHTPDLLRDVAHGDGVFIAVGGDANSMVMRSLDGVHWQQDLHPLGACDDEDYPASCTNWMGGVAHGDGVWLAGGGNGALMRSTDGGLSWAGLHPEPRPRAIRAIAHGSGRFVAGGDQGMVAVSDDDGESWTMHTLWEHGLEVTHGGGTFFAWGARWNGSGFDRACFVSVDAGDSWEACHATVAGSGSFVHDGERWIAPIAGGYASSADGVQWTSHTVEGMPDGLLFDGEHYYGRRGGDVYRATVLDDWTRTASDVPGYRAWAVGAVLDANLPVTDVPACQDNR